MVHFTIIIILEHGIEEEEEVEVGEALAGVQARCQELACVQGLDRREYKVRLAGYRQLVMAVKCFDSEYLVLKFPSELFVIAYLGLCSNVQLNRAEGEAGRAAGDEASSGYSSELTASSFGVQMDLVTDKATCLSTFTAEVTRQSSSSALSATLHDAVEGCTIVVDDLRDGGLSVGAGRKVGLTIKPSDDFSRLVAELEEEEEDDGGPNFDEASSVYSEMDPLYVYHNEKHTITAGGAGDVASLLGDVLNLDDDDDDDDDFEYDIGYQKRQGGKDSKAAKGGKKAEVKERPARPAGFCDSCRKLKSENRALKTRLAKISYLEQEHRRQGQKLFMVKGEQREIKRMLADLSKWLERKQVCNGEDLEFVRGQMRAMKRRIKT